MPFQEELTGVRTWHLMFVVLYVVKTTNTTVHGGRSCVLRNKAASSILPKWQ